VVGIIRAGVREHGVVIHQIAATVQRSYG